MSTSPLFLSPATPSELALYISSQCVYPTTLVICTTQGEWDYALKEDIAREMRRHNPGLSHKAEDDEHQDPQQDGAMGQDEDIDFSIPEPADDDTPTWTSPLLQHSIHRVAIQKHIRVVFIPSVSHLRAWLTVLPPPDPKLVPPPPPPPSSTKPATTSTTTPCPPSSKSTSTPLLLVYGFLDIHRDTSEWSALALGNSASTLVEAAWAKGMRAVVVEPKMDWHEKDWDLDAILAQQMPMLGGQERKAVAGGGGGDGGDEQPGWVGRTVAVRRVLGRWCRFAVGSWEGLRDERREENG